jgi:BolA protein
MKRWIDRIEDLLIEKLNPSKLFIEDKTHLHQGHHGHDENTKHLKIQIESPLFQNKSKIEQHRMVLDLLKPHLKINLHSVSIETRISTE